MGFSDTKRCCQATEKANISFDNLTPQIINRQQILCYCPFFFILNNLKKTCNVSQHQMKSAQISNIIITKTV